MGGVAAPPPKPTPPPPAVTVSGPGPVNVVAPPAEPLLPPAAPPAPAPRPREDGPDRGLRRPGLPPHRAVRGHRLQHDPVPLRHGLRDALPRYGLRAVFADAGHMECIFLLPSTIRLSR